MISFIKEEKSAKDNNDEISLKKIIEIISLILKQRFPGDLERQKIVSRLNGQRLNFCCCYCGDSHDNPRKKRGNFYTNWLYYKCYNGGCEEYVDFIKMMNDFKIDSSLSIEELSSLKTKIAASKDEAKNRKIMQHELSLNVLINTDFSKILVPRDLLMKQLNLMEIHIKSPMGVYLSARSQYIDKKFAWDPKWKKLFIFNLDEKQELIFSLQTRQFNNVNSKYLTYNINGIWTKLMGNKNEEFLNSLIDLDKISTVFNVLTINFNEVVTLFEGPMDSFLFNNSVGMCSINNSWPFDMDNIRWFQDNDEAGKKKALQVIAEGKPVFLWKKFIDDFELHDKKLKDYNDIVTYSKTHNINFSNIEHYFSVHRYDGIFL